jgi:prepilin-type N-terminal cleavage/methylation domain-containing protein
MTPSDINLTLRLVPGFSPPRRAVTARPRAFTLIELLLVVGIIAILIGLLLPAVQSAREAARKTQCANNLLQLGVAISNYAAAHRTLPPGSVNDTSPIYDLPKGYHYSWTVQILPFLELDTLYRRFDLRESVYSPRNQTVQESRVRTFLCPSSRASSGINYAGCHHDVEAPIAEDNHGVLYLNSRVRYDDIVDGPASTILLGETDGAGTLGWASGTRATLRNTGMGINDNRLVVAPVGPRSAPTKQANLGAVKAVVSLPKDAQDSLAVTNGIVLVDFVGGFASAHFTGAQFLFCDGSVRFLNHSIDQRVYRLLGHRADGELISGDSY